MDDAAHVETLQHLISLLDDASQAATARKLLARYTTVSFETPQQQVTSHFINRKFAPYLVKLGSTGR